MLCQRKKCSRLQHPVSFPEKTMAIGNVHGDVLRIRTVERRVPIWQVLAVSVHNRDLVLHAEHGRKFVGRFHKTRSDVDPADRAPKAARNITGGATEPASDIEDAVARSDGQAVGKLYGG